MSSVSAGLCSRYSVSAKGIFRRICLRDIWCFRQSYNGEVGKSFTKGVSESVEGLATKLSATNITADIYSFFSSYSTRPFKSSEIFEYTSIATISFIVVDAIDESCRITER